jgi:hypothetical protein
MHPFVQIEFILRETGEPDRDACPRSLKRRIQPSCVRRSLALFPTQNLPSCQISLRPAMVPNLQERGNQNLHTVPLNAYQRPRPHPMAR